jgi:hypothetical protein
MFQRSGSHLQGERTQARREDQAVALSCGDTEQRRLALDFAVNYRMHFWDSTVGALPRHDFCAAGTLRAQPE